MGFTAKLALLYLVLLIMVILSFLKRKKWIGISLLAVMIIGVAVLGFLWITSPM